MALGGRLGHPERVLDLSGVWEREGDVGRVLTASLSVDPTGSRASWIAGGSEGSTLMIGDLETGEATEAVDYPLDHACLDPAWLADGSALLAHRAAVWSEDGMVVEDFGPTEWYSRDGAPLPGAVELDPGCRLRWYTGEDGSAEDSTATWPSPSCTASTSRASGSRRSRSTISAASIRR
ncbi:hypothetical protein GCM10029992_08300 [Glycomyces albus]